MIAAMSINGSPTIHSAVTGRNAMSPAWVPFTSNHTSENPINMEPASPMNTLLRNGPMHRFANRYGTSAAASVMANINSVEKPGPAAANSTTIDNNATRLRLPARPSMPAIMLNALVAPITAQIVITGPNQPSGIVPKPSRSPKVLRYTPEPYASSAPSTTRAHK